MKKQDILNTLEKLPKEFTLDELIERLLVIEKINQGLADVKAGRTVTHAEAKKRIRKWLK